MSDLSKKVALITGASGGLGNFVTEAFLAVGATVVGVARSIQPSAFADPKFVAMPADLSRGEGTKEMVEAAIQRFEKIDMLVHVMGGFAGGELIDDTDDATWDKMMNLNLRSAFNICRAVLPHMRRAKRGRVIAIGARSAVEPKAYLSAYCASKAALVSLIRTVALEGKDDGITANVILPGTMDTPANRTDSPSADFSKWVPPSRVASLALWLASEEASQVSGALIPVYGGGL
ncbi:MAG TPA: SDR family NAD(P)-dependent oxidoreductase [Terriglobia bacterium]|nr:SDR family NAD(P)-dependent oxidoreductase [Terriglobia bacterium]